MGQSIYICKGAWINIKEIAHFWFPVNFHEIPSYARAVFLEGIWDWDLQCILFPGQRNPGLICTENRMLDLYTDGPVYVLWLAAWYTGRQCDLFFLWPFLIFLPLSPSGSLLWFPVVEFQGIIIGYYLLKGVGNRVFGKEMQAVYFVYQRIP